MQSYGVMEQETTKSPFFVPVTCGGDTISATDSEHFDITVAKKNGSRADFRFSILIFGEQINDLPP